MDEPYGPIIAQAIPITGAIVAIGLLVHIIGTLFDLFGTVGKGVLFVLLVAAAGGAFGLKVTIIDKFITAEGRAVGVEKK